MDKYSTTAVKPRHHALLLYKEGENPRHGVFSHSVITYPSSRTVLSSHTSFHTGVASGKRCTAILAGFRLKTLPLMEENDTTSLIKENVLKNATN